MNYSLGNMLSRGGALNPDGLSLDLAFALDKTLTARKGPTPTFSRASGATEIGSDGFIRYAPENLLTRSNDFVNADWTAERATVSSNTTVAPDGSATADKLTEDSTASNSHRITRQLNLSAIPYTFSVFAKASERSWIRMTLFDGTTSRQVWFDVSAGVIGTQSGAIGQIASFGNGWWRCSITATGLAFISSQTNIALATADNVTVYTGDGTSGLFLWGAQLERYSSARTYIPTTTAAVYGARFDHDPVTLASRGLLVEEARTNVALRSEEFNESAWVKNGLIAAPPTVTANQVNSPSGVLSADRIAFPAVSGAGAYSLAAQSIALTSGSVYTASIYLRGLNGGEKVWWSWTPNGVTYARKECVLTTSWQRFDVAFTASAVANFIQIGVDLRDASQSAQSAQTIFAWGAQLELGSFPTSYIPTTTASVVRSADVCSITGANFTSFYNQSEGTMFTDSYPAAVAGTVTTFGISNGTASARWLNRFAPNEQVVVTASGVESTLDAINPVANQRVKVASAAKLNDLAMSIDGLAVVTDTSQPMPTVDRAGIGNSLGTNIAGAVTITRIQYFRKRLPNAKLQALTAP